MTFRTTGVQLRDNTLSESGLKKLKWCTTIAIIGLPLLVQSLGAMMFFSDAHPVLMSAPALAVFAAAFVLVVGAGVYTISNRVFLRFSGRKNGLQEWESKTQSDAFAFSYRMIAKAVLAAFLAVSVLGLIQFLNMTGVIKADFNPSFALNTQGIAAISLMLTYLVLLLPTLYIAWTLAPLNADDA